MRLLIQLLLGSYSVKFLLSFLGSPDGQVDIHAESEDGNRNTPVLELAEIRIEQELVEDELVDHLQIAEHLEFTGCLVLECFQLKGLSPNYTHGHPEEHQPVGCRENAGIVHEGLAKDNHSSGHKDWLDNVCPRGQRLCSSLLHFTKGDGTHAYEYRIQDEEKERQIMIVSIFVAILFMIAHRHKKRCNYGDYVEQDFDVLQLLREDEVG